LARRVFPQPGGPYLIDQFVRFEKKAEKELLLEKL
jgi:hypothetical protein